MVPCLLARAHDAERAVRSSPAALPSDDGAVGGTGIEPVTPACKAARRRFRRVSAAAVKTRKSMQHKALHKARACGRFLPVSALFDAQVPPEVPPASARPLIDPRPRRRGGSGPGHSRPICSIGTEFARRWRPSRALTLRSKRSSAELRNDRRVDCNALRSNCWHEPHVARTHGSVRPRRNEKPWKTMPPERTRECSGGPLPACH